MELFVDLDNNLKTMLVSQSTIYEMRSMPYTNDVFDRLFTMLKVYAVDRVCVITHNIYTKCQYLNSCLAFTSGSMASLISHSDLEKILTVCKEAGITNIKFVDKAGIYVLDRNRNACYVEHYNGMVYMYCVNETISDFAMSTEAAFNEKRIEFMEKNGLTEVADCPSNVDMCMQFLNAAMVLDDEKVLKDLCVFAYAALEKEFVYDVSVIGNVAQPNTKQPMSSKAQKQPKRPKELKRSKQPNLPRQLKQPSIKKSVGKKRVLNVLSYIILILGLVIASVAIFFSWKRVDMGSEVEAMENSKAELEKLVDSQHSMLLSYQAYLDKPYNTPAQMYNEMQKIVGKHGGELQAFSFDGKNIVASVPITSVTQELLMELGDAGYETDLYDTGEGYEVELRTTF